MATAFRRIAVFIAFPALHISSHLVMNSVIRISIITQFVIPQTIIIGYYISFRVSPPSNLTPPYLLLQNFFSLLPKKIAIFSSKKEEIAFWY
jgi:hypothetical protein